jgi:hypothetical protein
MSSDDAWPFEDPPNVAVFTVNKIAKQGQPVLLVVHDEEDGGWQFLDGESLDMADALLVSLASMLKRDPSLALLADLPPGWQARRDSAAGPWKREKIVE